VVQLAAKEWLSRRRKSKERTSTLAELAAAELSGPVQRGKLENALNGIGYQAAEQLEQLLCTRFGALPENEVTAAIDAVVDALRDTDLSDEALLDADADPEELARRIRRQLPGQTRTAGLSSQATELYEVILDQACRYLVQVIRQLPAFQPRALAEVLGRLSTLSGQITEILARTPRTSLDAPRGTTHDEAFRAEYLRYIAATVDKLELLGLTMKHRPRLALSMAYLSLTVSEQDTNRRSRFARDHFADHWFGQAQDRDQTSTVRVEAAIGDAQRTLVRGEAGSGKTTLLDWLAVTAARGGFTDQLQDWNGCVPFLVRLRRHVDTALPRPEQFLDYAAGPLAGLTPEGWVHRCLGSGQALLLVDGVDEIPAKKRRAVRTWLAELVAAYPKIRIVVTARPAAADQKWLAEEGFASVVLAQMSAGDIQLFMERWHEAAANADSLPCEPHELPAAQRRLRTQLDARPHLRALAANPLLCAMLCALNLGRTSELPHNRMELYRAALTMLLDLRDAERNIPGLLDATEKTVLLRDLAWRLTLSNRTELPRTEALELVTRKLCAMPNVNEEPDTILNHVVERSGALREPVPGRIDFVHRTFQEYLAASEATEEKYIPVLIDRAHLDSWRETIVMACGHAKRSQLRELLTAILERADTDPRHARRLRLLAAACLETITDIDPDVRDRIDHVITTKLVPPKSTRETRSLAGIGHRILRYLPESLGDLSEAAAVATVRAAALTNNPEALPRLGRYAQDQRQAVQDEVVNSWQYFDPECYTAEVLADMPLIGGRLTVSSKHLIRYAGQLNNATRIAIDIPFFDPLDNLRPLTELRNIDSIRLNLTKGPADLAPLAAHPDLTSIWLDGPDCYRGTSTLTQLPHLTDLSLLGSQPFDIELVQGLPCIRSLHLRNPTNFQALGRLEQLEVLNLYLCAELLSLDPIRHLNQIKTLAITCCDIPDLTTQICSMFPLVKDLNLSGSDVADISTLSSLQLSRLVLNQCKVADLTPLSTQRELKFLHLAWCPNVRDFSPLAGRNLELWLSAGQDYPGIEKLGPGSKIHYFA
jgi:hypothetical protein